MHARSIVSTQDAPKAIGPYSQAIVSAGMVFTSGQIGLDPATGELVQGDVRAQTQRALENLTAVLAKAGSDLRRAIRCTVYLIDMADFAAMNEVYGRWFPADAPPARSTVAVHQLPKGARVEIDVIASL